MTFFQPPNFSAEFFDRQIELVDLELAKLKQSGQTSASSFYLDARRQFQPRQPRWNKQATANYRPSGQRVRDWSIRMDKLAIGMG
jgi:hypothetical protein